MLKRELFFKHLGQTSPAPLSLEIVRAEGVHLYDVSGKKYLDAIGGISVCNTATGIRMLLTPLKIRPIVTCMFWYMGS